MIQGNQKLIKDEKVITEFNHLEFPEHGIFHKNVGERRLRLNLQDFFLNKTPHIFRMIG